MADQEILFRVLRKFARTMAGSYDITEVLHDLSESAVEVFGATAAGIALCDGDDLRFITATSPGAVELEQQQERSQSGPCYTSLEQCRPVAVRDVRDRRSEWPEYCLVAERVGLVSVLGLPLVLDDRRVGSMDVYASEPKAWSEEAISAGAVLADVAAAFVLNLSELAQSQRTTEQLQIALDSRVIIEQAKGKLAGQLDISPDEAFELLRRYSRRNQVRVRSTARAILERGADVIGPMDRGARA